MNEKTADEIVAGSVSDVRRTPLAALAESGRAGLGTLARVTGRPGEAKVPVATFNSSI
jgi:FXSXX-COOH protein